MYSLSLSVCNIMNAPLTAVCGQSISSGVSCCRAQQWRTTFMCVVFVTLICHQPSTIATIATINHQPINHQPPTKLTLIYELEPREIVFTHTIN